VNAEARSRRLNARLGGSHAEMLCARLDRHRWCGLWVVADAWFTARHGEPGGHCARVHWRHRLRLAEPDERVRLLDGRI
jgi:hypothetical protein